MRQSAAKPQQNTCIHCTETKPLERFVKDKKAKLGVRNVCLDCSLERSKQAPDYREVRNARVAKFRKTLRGGVSQRMMAAKRRAKKDRLPFDLDMDYLMTLWSEQRGICALSKQPIVIGDVDWWHRASIDKIYPEKGYIKGNVQFLSMRVNAAKGNLNNKEFFELCKQIVEEGSTTISKESTSQAIGDGSAEHSERDDDIV